MVNSLNDGLSKPDQLAVDAVVTAEITDDSVTTAKLAAASVDSAKQGFVGIGSPSAFGNSIQMGEIVASAGSIAEIAFPTSFGAAPFVTVTFVGGIAAHPDVSANGGSAIINTITASASGTWIAVGSGAF